VCDGGGGQVGGTKARPKRVKGKGNGREREDGEGTEKREMVA